MQMRTIIPILSFTSLVTAKPLSPLRPAKRQFTNSTSLSVITETSIETVTSTTTTATSPTCTSTYTASKDTNCGETAATFNIRLSGQEADYPSQSEKCESLLRGYGICSTNANDNQSNTLSSFGSYSTANSTQTPLLNGTATSLILTNATVTPTIGNNFTAQAIGTKDSTVVAQRTETYTYTLGAYSTTRVTTAVVTHTDVIVVTFDMSMTLSDPTQTHVTASSAPAITTSITLAGSSLSVPISESSSASGPGTGVLASAASGSSAPIGDAVTSTSSTGRPTLSSAHVNGGASKTPSVAACSVTVAAPASTQANIVASCSKWYVAAPGDDCLKVAQENDVAVNTFMDWNPAVVAPACSRMLAGYAYCVAVCENSLSSASSATTTILTSPQVIGSSPSTSFVPSISTATSFVNSSASSTAALATSTLDKYSSYSGNGTASAGWPSMNQWVPFDYMFQANQANMQASCLAWGVQDDTSDEIADMRSAIQSIGSSAGIDPRFILAIIMQESTGCVRVITTAYSVQNPGLMQSHNGTGSCNRNSAAIGVPGTSATAANVQYPCPMSEIAQMIEDGTEGTSSGDGLKQIFARQQSPGRAQDTAYYRTAREYNGGSVAPDGNLSEGCCTQSYASDIANRLTGWVNAPRNFTP